MLDTPVLLTKPLLGTSAEWVQPGEELELQGRRIGSYKLECKHIRGMKVSNNREL